MKSDPQTILVTGGCGFLGSNIAASYLAQGATVVVIDALFRTGGVENLSWLNSLARNSGHLFHYQVDLAVGEHVDEIVSRHAPLDYVCHLGGQVAMTTSLQDPLRDLRTNVLGTFNVLEAVRRHSPNALVAYSSTNKVYGDLEDFEYEETATRYVMPGYPDGLDESLRLDFASPYGCSKGAADQYVRDWFRNFGLKTVVFRHSSIYGGRQFSTFDQGWIGWFCRQALLQSQAREAGNQPEPFTISGSGKQVRDVLHADDLIRLYQTAYRRSDQVAGNIFNIGGGMSNSLSLLELFGHLNEITGQEALEFSHLPPRQSDQKCFVADISKAKKILGWEPQVTAQTGLQRMIEWERACAGNKT